MEIAASTAQLLWNLSYQAVLDTMQTRQFVMERHSSLAVAPAIEHEETTTSNLLRRIGYYGQKVGAYAAQHTRTLEGGLSKNGRQIIVPSGADLELAIEVSPGQWLDLLLQAKAFKPTGTYSSWSPQQNQKLITWANRHGRTPGMLLYNDHLPPFVTNAPPMTGADYACTAFGGCGSVSRAQLGKWAETKYCFGPDATPAGVSLCLDQALMGNTSPAPNSIRPYHFQLEHLLHVGEHGDAIDAQGKTLRGLARPARPKWATELIESRMAESADAIDVDQEARDDDQRDSEEVAAKASVVIPFDETESPG